MKNFYVYILECSDGIYYTGLTADIERRLNEHQSGINPDSYTYKRRPVKLVFYTMIQGYEQASCFEKKLKDWSRAKKKALIDENWEKLKDAAMCMNETSHRFYKKDVSTPLDTSVETIKDVSTPLDTSMETIKDVSTPLDKTVKSKRDVSTPLDKAAESMNNVSTPLDKTDESNNN